MSLSIVITWGWDDQKPEDGENYVRNSHFSEDFRAVFWQGVTRFGKDPIGQEVSESFERLGLFCSSRRGRKEGNSIKY
jgi:hypothetical protein